MIKAILFDLDGTLLKMDQEEFIKAYFGGLAKKLAPLGYEPKALIGAVMAGTEAMQRNDGTKTNETVFWNTFAKICGEESRGHINTFEQFYQNEFQQIEQICGLTEQAKEVVSELKKNFRLALATNPVFPKIATHSRIRWAGFKVEDFELITTYEEDCFCKPTEGYFKSVALRLGVKPEECLMVGNDVEDDMPALKAGMKVFLLTDCLINKKGADISQFPHGNFKDLLAFVQDKRNLE